MMADETPEVRPRKSGKTAEKFAKLTGLKPETCMDLLAAGWTLEREHQKPTRWVQGRGRRDIPASVALAQGGIVSGIGPLVGDRPGPGFGPGPSLGAGAIQIQVVNDPSATAHGVADAIRRVREHQAQMRQEDRR